MGKNEIASGIVDYLLTLQEGTEISTMEAIEKLYEFEVTAESEYKVAGESIADMTLFAIDRDIRRMARKKGIVLDSSKYEGMPMGMPFAIPYVIRKGGKRMAAADGEIVKM